MSKIKSKVYSLGQKRKLTLVWRPRIDDKRAPAAETFLRLEVGHAISNPNDKFDKAKGLLIATSRLDHWDDTNRVAAVCLESIKFIPVEAQETFMDGLAITIKANLGQFVKGLK
jgi:hypothetical protein